MRIWQTLMIVVFGSLAASFARTETVEIRGDYGGLVYWYQLRWQKLASQGVNVRIAGPCASACTVLVSYIPREKICVTSNGSLGFHVATDGSVTRLLLTIYPPDIRAWIDHHGGLGWNMLWLQSPALYRFFRRC
jgi:hypothetical protein